MFNVEPMKQTAARSKTAPMVAAVVFLVCASVHAGVSAPAYTLTDLNNLPSSAYSEGEALNDLGQATGSYFTGPGYRAYDQDVFLYTGGAMTPIVEAGRADDVAAYGRAINNSGQVVGSIEGPGPFSAAFLYASGNVQNLTFGPYSFDNTPFGINGAGVVVGRSGTNRYGGAFIESGGVVQMPSKLDVGYAVNAAGQVAGEDTNWHAALYSNGSVTDLGTLPGGDLSYATALNSSGDVVGASIFGNTADTHAFLYSNGVMRDLTPGGRASEAKGINDGGQIVGNFIDVRSPVIGDVPFLYDQATLFDLNSLIQNAPPGYVLLDANGINSSGQIVGTARSPSGVTHAVLLTPLAVPLPLAAWASLTALPILLLRKRLRRAIA